MMRQLSWLKRITVAWPMPRLAPVRITVLRALVMAASLVEPPAGARADLECLTPLGQDKPCGQADEHRTRKPFQGRRDMAVSQQPQAQAAAQHADDAVDEQADDDEQQAQQQDRKGTRRNSSH